MAQIIVVHQSGNGYLVTVKEGTSSTKHEVTVTPDHIARYAGTGVSPEKLLQVSFEFLLEREPKEAILSHFELPVIERYFPEYPSRIREKL